MVQLCPTQSNVDSETFPRIIDIEIEFDIIGNGVELGTKEWSSRVKLNSTLSGDGDRSPQ